MSIDITNGVEQPRRHHKYYFTFIIFEVEKVLFKVPRHPFEDESELFKDMFALPPGDDIPEGFSDSKPFVLHDVTVKDFEALLKVLLPDPICEASNSLEGRASSSEWSFTEESDSLSREEWISVLHLSHKWTINRFFKLATQKLEKLISNPVTKITLAKTYSITSWLQSAYFSMATRKEPLTLEEATELGMDTVLKLNTVRELRYRWIIEDDKAEASQTSAYPYTRPSPKVKKGKKIIAPVPSRLEPTEEDLKKYVDRVGAFTRKAISDVFGL